MATSGGLTHTSANAPEPSTTAMSNFSFGDLMTWGSVTAASIPFGYMVGRPIRGPTMGLTAAIGATGGFMLAYQNSVGRLTGRKAP